MFPVAGLAKSGEKLNGGVIKVSPSKTPIVPINREFMPRDEKELERCERTVYVNQIDRAVPGSAVEAMFENFCGTHTFPVILTVFSFEIPACTGLDALRLVRCM